MNSRFIISKIFLLILIVVSIGGLYMSLDVLVKNKERQMTVKENKAADQWQGVFDISKVSGEYLSTSSNATIQVVRMGPKTISVIGEAIWDGPNGQVHTGSMEGAVILQGNSGMYHDDVCEATLTFMPPVNTSEETNLILSVVDNDRCGGVNVSFTGEYVKK